MRVLLDSNVLIAALITQGVCADLFDHCVRQHQIVASQFILKEVEGHLRKKFRFSEAEVYEAMDLLQGVIHLIEPVSLKEPICRDLNDDIILATSLAGNVDCIVSGDKDLTDLGNFEGIPIFKPSEFTAFETRNQK
jgi:putative PIN family toxin of toxin-antitoxin system